MSYRSGPFAAIISAMALSPGMVVSRPSRDGFWTHYGVLSDRLGPDGRPTVLNANRRGHVIEESWTQFAEGQHVEVQGSFGNLPSREIVRRARADLGRPWQAFSFNCEQAVQHWHGVPAPDSPQLRKTLLLCMAPVFAAVLIT